MTDLLYYIFVLIMDTNELRLGNFIMDKKDENIEYVYQLYNLGDLIYINDIDPDCYVPIPITKRWINHLGFKPISESEDTLHTFEREGFQLWNKNGDFSVIACVNNGISFEVKYVHQIQNLFFALKGKEL